MMLEACSPEPTKSQIKDDYGKAIEVLFVENRDLFLLLSTRVLLFAMMNDDFY